MATTIATQRQFKVSDLEHFPDDGQRYEVIDGELYVSHAPHWDHQNVVSEIDYSFRAWDPMKVRGSVAAGVSVIFAVDTGVIPDLVWVQAARATAVLVDPLTGKRDGRLHAAPDLAVEVLSAGSANVARDREVKLTLYSRRAVKEYWLVDRTSRTVEVYRRGDAARLELAATLTDQDRLTSPLLDGFAVPISQLFALPAWLPG